MGAIQQVLAGLGGMVRFTASVAASADDCTETITSSFATNSPNLLLGKGSTYAYNSGVRFLDVTVPQGATIIQAYISLYSSAAQSGDTCRVRVYGEDADDAITYSDVTDFNGRVATTAYGSWTISTWSDNTWYDTPSLVSVVQEIVDRESWASGNSMAFMLMDSSSTTDALRIANAYDYLGGKPPVLTIVYAP